MTDYNKLVEALRYCAETPEEEKDCYLCDYYPKCSDVIAKDASTAIEELQADVDKANKSADAYRAMYFAKRGDITIEKVRELDEIDCHFHSALIRLMYKRIEELEAQLPKRGEWKCSYPEIEPNPMFMYGICSICGFEQSISNKLNYCPNCGAKMEVQE